MIPVIGVRESGPDCSPDVKPSPPAVSSTVGILLPSPPARRRHHLLSGGEREVVRARMAPRRRPPPPPPSSSPAPADEEAPPPPSSPLKLAGGVFPVFVNTSLETHLAVAVCAHDTVEDFKQKLKLDHAMCFPNVGEISVQAIKVQRGRHSYHLPDSMPVRSAFEGISSNWLLDADVHSMALIQTLRNTPRESGDCLNQGKSAPMEEGFDMHSKDELTKEQLVHADARLCASLVQGDPSSPCSGKVRDAELRSSSIDVNREDTGGCRFGKSIDPEKSEGTGIPDIDSLINGICEAVRIDSAHNVETLVDDAINFVVLKKFGVDHDDVGANDVLGYGLSPKKKNNRKKKSNLPNDQALETQVKVDSAHNVDTLVDNGINVVGRKEVGVDDDVGANDVLGPSLSPKKKNNRKKKSDLPNDQALETQVKDSLIENNVRQNGKLDSIGGGLHKDVTPENDHNAPKNSEVMVNLENASQESKPDPSYKEITSSFQGLNDEPPHERLPTHQELGNRKKKRKKVEAVAEPASAVEFEHVAVEKISSADNEKPVEESNSAAVHNSIVDPLIPTRPSRRKKSKTAESKSASDAQFFSGQDAGENINLELEAVYDLPKKPSKKSQARPSVIDPLKLNSEGPDHNNGTMLDREEVLVSQPKQADTVKPSSHVRKEKSMDFQKGIKRLKGQEMESLVNDGPGTIGEVAILPASKTSKINNVQSLGNDFAVESHHEIYAPVNAASHGTTTGEADSHALKPLKKKKKSSKTLLECAVENQDNHQEKMDQVVTRPQADSGKEPTEWIISSGLVNEVILDSRFKPDPVNLVKATDDHGGQLVKTPCKRKRKSSTQAKESLDLSLDLVNHPSLDDLVHAIELQDAMPPANDSHIDKIIKKKKKKKSTSLEKDIIPGFVNLPSTADPVSNIRQDSRADVLDNTLEKLNACEDKTVDDLEAEEANGKPMAQVIKGRNDLLVTSRKSTAGFVSPRQNHKELGIHQQHITGNKSSISQGKSNLLLPEEVDYEDPNLDVAASSDSPEDIDFDHKKRYRIENRNVASKTIAKNLADAGQKIAIFSDELEDEFPYNNTEPSPEDSSSSFSSLDSGTKSVASHGNASDIDGGALSGLPSRGLPVVEILKGSRSYKKVKTRLSQLPPEDEMVPESEPQ